MQSFDPYKSSFSTMGEGVNIHNVVSNSASTNYDFGQKLEELKQKRWVYLYDLNILKTLECCKKFH